MLPEDQQMLKSVSKSRWREEKERRPRRTDESIVLFFFFFVEGHLQSLEGMHWSGEHKPASHRDCGVTE